MPITKDPITGETIVFEWPPRDDRNIRIFTRVLEKAPRSETEAKKVDEHSDFMLMEEEKTMSVTKSVFARKKKDRQREGRRKKADDTTMSSLFNSLLSTPEDASDVDEDDPWFAESEGGDGPETPAWIRLLSTDERRSIFGTVVRVQQRSGTTLAGQKVVEQKLMNRFSLEEKRVKELLRFLYGGP